MKLTEIQRRSKHMNKLFELMGGEHRPIVKLVTQCLHNDPGKRPSARQVLDKLEELSNTEKNPLSGLAKLLRTKVLLHTNYP